MKKLILALIMVCVFTSVGWTASKSEDYDLQERCFKTARKRFDEEYDFQHYTYQNYYNKKLNKCFIWVLTLGTPHIEYLYDVNERGYYGMLAMGDTGETIVCQIYKDAQHFKNCHDIFEWSSLVKPYMEE